MNTVYSKHGVPIRLSANRWLHIVEQHDDVAGYYDTILDAIESPDAIVQGKTGELLALKIIDGRTLVVVYKETSRSDGFVITAFFTTEPRRITKRGMIWPKQ